MLSVADAGDEDVSRIGPNRTHGLRSAYNDGCRCSKCRAAAVRWQQERRVRNRAERNDAYFRELALSRRMKERYRRPCPQCGRLMTGGDGNGPNAPQRCIGCQARMLHEERKWTPETITAAIQLWVQEHGRPPSANDWRAANGRGTPPTATVQREFGGSWAAAIEAAGFPRPRSGHYDRSRRKVAA